MFGWVGLAWFGPHGWFALLVRFGWLGWLGSLFGVRLVWFGCFGLG